MGMPCSEPTGPSVCDWMGSASSTITVPGVTVVTVNATRRLVPAGMSRYLLTPSGSASVRPTEWATVASAPGRDDLAGDLGAGGGAPNNAAADGIVGGPDSCGRCACVIAHAVNCPRKRGAFTDTGSPLLVSGRLNWPCARCALLRR
jgi:hypothetical protein